MSRLSRRPDRTGPDRTGGVYTKHGVDLTPLPPTERAARAPDSDLPDADSHRPEAQRQVPPQAPACQDQDEQWAVETALGACLRAGHSADEFHELLAEIRRKKRRVTNLTRYCVDTLNARRADRPRQDDPPAPAPPDRPRYAIERQPGETPEEHRVRVDAHIARRLAEENNPRPPAQPTPEEKAAGERARAVARAAYHERLAKMRSAESPPPPPAP